MLQRSPTYLASLPSTNPVTRLIRRLVPRRAEGTVLRWFNVTITQGFYALSRRRPQMVKRALRQGVERELPAGYDIDTHFTPRYDPWDQRLCVITDGDLFRNIGNGSVEMVTDHIERFTTGGLKLKSGRELTADVIVTATGLDLLFIGGMELSVDGDVVQLPDRMTYKGMMLEGVPNFSMAVGYTNASWTLKSDLTSVYVCRILRRLRASTSTTCTPVSRGVTPTKESLLELKAGYVVRSADRFPKQGTAAPWRVYQNYLQDYRALKRDRFDESLEFTCAQVAEVTGAGARRG